jgi:hypothetical protein
MDLMIENVSCTEHGKRNISLDNKTFQIFCKSCLTNNIDNDNGTQNLQILNNSHSDSNNTKNNINKTCYKHLTEDAQFYCDDCSEFICKNCFATDHRQHCSSTHELIVKNIKENLQKTVMELHSLKKNVEESIQSMQELNNYFSTQKSSFKNSLKDINDRILKNLNNKAKEFSEDIENIFNGIDLEVESSTQRLENNRRKANKMLNEFQNFYKEVESIKSEKKVCLYKKEKDAVLNQNKKFLSDLQFFLQENLEKTKEKSVKEMENFSKKCLKFQRNATIYENSVTNTIVSGIPNICMRIRRFKNYFFDNTTMFKTDSLCMLTSHTVGLVGFSICGLFNQALYENQNSKSDSKNSTTNNNLIKHQNTLKSLKLGLKIFEMDSFHNIDLNKTPICSLEVEVPLIVNVIDPVCQFYLNNSVTISKDKVYYIIINNLSDHLYIDVWKGKVSKESDDMTENQHSIICNNSNVKFNFLNAFGVESDINEFSGGILSDIIFSHID